LPCWRARPPTDVVFRQPAASPISRSGWSLRLIGGIGVVCAYVPNGQAVGSDKYAYKLAWLDALTRLARRVNWPANPRLVVAGDFNIAPGRPRRAQPGGLGRPDPVLRTRAERPSSACWTLGLKDSFRLFEQPEKSFSWWDYRMLGFQKNQRTSDRPHPALGEARRALYGSRHQPGSAQARAAIRSRAGDRRSQRTQQTQRFMNTAARNLPQRPCSPSTPRCAHCLPNRWPNLCQAMSARELPAGTQLFAEHQDCMGFPLLLAGTIKVVKSTATGREMLLYRVEPGGSCIISSSCLLGHTPYSARGIAETPLSLLLLPITLFERLVADNALFRDFVFHLFAERIAELMQLVEEVAFHRLDQRLAKLLLARGDQPSAPRTRPWPRNSAASARSSAACSRAFAVQGLVRLGREQITVIDQAGLQQLADNKPLSDAPTSLCDRGYIQPSGSCVIWPRQPQTLTEPIMKTNVGGIDKILRIVVGIALISHGRPGGRRRLGLDRCSTRC
jgi:CRP/FNR family transcriptional regulator